MQKHLKRPKAITNTGYGLKILLSPIEIKPRLRIHVTFHMQRVTERFGPAEKHTRFGRGVDFANGSEDHVPVWSAVVRRGAEAGDGVAVAVEVVEHDVCRVVGAHFCR